ncbi:hypothetical protein TcWFU_001680 [Taenia crassiceps]|uniref:Ig-like domain-containing protein n=1 Tax=Taenia crassiceps TaxID=6207 RepID=A0ABR4QG60_9CEST
MPAGCTPINLLIILVTVVASIEPFRVVPQNLTVEFGTNVYQACQPAIRPDFINWYVNDRLVGGCLLQSVSITSKISDPRYKIYMSQEDEEGGIPVCYLVVQRLEEKDSGVWTCKSSHPDSNIYEVSAKVLVHDKTMRLKVFLQNGTKLRDKDTVQAICSAKGVRRPPNLRLMFGGEPVKTTSPTKVVEENGEYNTTISGGILLDWRSHLRLLTCHADVGDFKSVQQTFLVIHLSTTRNGKKEQNPYARPIYPLGACGDTPDKLDAFFGIASTEKTQNHLENKSPLSSPSPTPSSLNNLLLPVPGEFILYVDESADVIVITCEVSIPSKDHSVHLLCPLVPETRLCFENCRRVCSLPDCTDKPKLFTVECVEDLFVRDMHNIWKFRYIVDRREAAVEGTWNCFHAGKSTETVNVTATPTTTAEPIRRSTSVGLGVEGTLSPWLESFIGQPNLHQMTGGKHRGNNNASMTTKQPQGNKKNTSFDKAVVMVLVIFLAVSISINIVYVFISYCKKEKSVSEVRLCGLKENPTMTPSTPMVIPQEDRISGASPWKGSQIFAVPPSAISPPFPAHQLQPPAFLHPSNERNVTSNEINGSGLCVLHSTSLQTPTLPEINSFTTLRPPNSSIRVAFAVYGYVSTLYSTVQNDNSSTCENLQSLTPFCPSNNIHKRKTKSMPPPH